MHLFARSCVFVALSVLATALAWGRAPNDPAILSTAQLIVPKLQQRPTLEEFLGMEPTGAGLGMLKITGFKQRDPKDGAPVSQPTEVYVGYTGKNLYVVFICFDEPRLIRARMERRELIDEDDQVGFVLDTFNDHKAAVFFYINPLGIQQDGIWTEPGGPDYSYDMLWHSDARLNGRGYVAWFEIPFKSLRFPARAQQKWGLFFARDIRRNNEYAYYPHISSNRHGFLSQETTAEGLENISPGRNLQFVPYASFRAFRAVDERPGGVPRFTGKHAEPNVGLDSKIVIRDSLVLDATINPDFAQVESDAPQTVVNQRFEVFFPEKRPFFLENASYFSTPIDLLFTRRIADPLYGVRLTGKLGPWAIGLLLANDQSPGKVVLETDPLTGRSAYFGVLRIKRDVGKESSVGIIYADRELDTQPNTLCTDLRRCTVASNRVGGIDTRIKFNSTWFMTAQALASSTRYFDGVREAGPSYQLYLQHSSRKLEYNILYNDTAPGFETETGFFRRPDIRRVSQFTQYRFRREGKALQWHGPSLFGMGNWDHTGRRLEYLGEVTYRWIFNRQTDFGVVAWAGEDHLRPSDFDTLPLQGHSYPRHGRGFWFNSGYFKVARVWAESFWGRAINFDPASGPPVTAYHHDGRAGVTLRPVRGLTVENSYIYLRLRDFTSGRNIFNDHIIRSKWNYQFTRDLSVRLIGQYNATIRNEDLSALAPAKRFNGDFLFTYLPHPGTAVYVGYSSGLQNYFPGLDRHGDGSLKRTRNSFINDGRQVFVKVSYLFRF